VCCSLSWRCGSALGAAISSSEVLPLICRLENLKAAHESFINAHHSARVVKFTAVVWCAEESDKLAALEELIAIFYDLMRTTDEINIMLLVKLSNNLLAKCKGNAAVIVTIGLNASFRVRPE